MAFPPRRDSPDHWLRIRIQEVTVRDGYARLPRMTKPFVICIKVSVRQRAAHLCVTKRGISCQHSGTYVPTFGYIA